MAHYHGLWDSASHPTVSTVERGSLVGRFIKLPILLIAFIVNLITAISLYPIEIDLDRPYILSNPSFANLELT